MLHYTDQMGNQIVLADFPRRIVSLVPSQTELLFDLGLNESVVGITRFCIHPEPKVKDKTIVGGTKNPNLDRIRELQPDLIIGNKEENRKEDIEALQREFPVWMSDVNTLADAIEMITEVGKLVGKETSALWIANLIEERFAKLVEDTTIAEQKIQAVYLIWRQPWMAAGSATFIHDILQRGGFSNRLGHMTRYPECTTADLKSLNPDLILFSTEPFPFNESHLSELRKICPAASLKIVRGDLFSWYGSRLLRTPQYLQTLRSAEASWPNP